ncbi:MAG: hypothetical protein ACOC3V_01810 [bacterium]
MIKKCRQAGNLWIVNDLGLTKKEMVEKVKSLFEDHVPIQVDFDENKHPNNIVDGILIYLRYYAELKCFDEKNPDYRFKISCSNVKISKLVYIKHGPSYVKYDNPGYINKSSIYYGLKESS